MIFQEKKSANAGPSCGVPGTTFSMALGCRFNRSAICTIYLRILCSIPIIFFCDPPQAFDAG